MNLIRGINKRIIEITDTGSDYFEKALLFVSAGTDIGDDFLKSEAERLLDSYSEPRTNNGMGYLRYREVKERKHRALKKVIAGLSVFILFGSAVLLLIIK